MEQTQPKKLYDIVRDGMEVTRMLTESGGELTPEIEQMLAVNETELAQKVDGYAAIMERLDSESDYWKAKAKEYTAIARSCDNARDSLKTRIKEAMNNLGVTELDGDDVRFKLTRVQEKLVIDDPKVIPAQFKMTVTEVVIDNARLREALTALEAVPGAHLEASSALRPYPLRKTK